MHNTHVNKISVRKGSQWVLFVATDVDAGVGVPLCTGDFDSTLVFQYDYKGP